jgi:hypothetical protein
LRRILSVWEGIQGKKMLQQFFPLNIEPILSFLTKEIGGEMKREATIGGHRKTQMGL